MTINSNANFTAITVIDLLLKNGQRVLYNGNYPASRDCVCQSIKNTAITVTTGSVINMDSINIGKMVRHYRKERRLSQMELAGLAGVGKAVVFDVEKGKETIQLNSLLKILNVLNIRLKFMTPLRLTTECEV